MPAPDTEARTDWEEMTVGDTAAGTRIDQWLSRQLGPAFSRNRVKTLVDCGDVILNGSATEPKKRLAAGDRVEWRVPEAEEARPQAQNIPLNILYEDEHLIVINKPAGLVVHPGAGNTDGTLVNALLHHCGTSLSGIGGVKRPGIVHRLDKETSGVMVVAKNDAAHKELSEAFADHGRSGELERSYRAIVWGTPSRMAGTIDVPIGRANTDRTKRAAVSLGRADARHAVTHFKVIHQYGLKPDATAFASMIECRLETGRTHQIRVHLSHIGHALIGDPVYGQGMRTKANLLPEPQRELVKAFPRQALHAAVLAFRHPASQSRLRFETPLPDDMADLASGLERL